MIIPAEAVLRAFEFWLRAAVKANSRIKPFPIIAGGRWRRDNSRATPRSAARPSRVPSIAAPMNRHAFTLAATFLVAPAVASAQAPIQRCEDESGRVTYTDAPCPAQTRATRELEAVPELTEQQRADAERKYQSTLDAARDADERRAAADREAARAREQAAEAERLARERAASEASHQAAIEDEHGYDVIDGIGGVRPERPRPPGQAPSRPIVRPSPR
jgi:hypothetical protein